MLETPDAAPTAFSTHAELVDEGQHRVTGDAAASLVGAVADGPEDRFDRIARAQMHPVFRREVVEREQGLAVLDEDRHRLWILRTYP